MKNTIVYLISEYGISKILKYYWLVTDSVRKFVGGLFISFLFSQLLASIAATSLLAAAGSAFAHFSQIAPTVDFLNLTYFFSAVFAVTSLIAASLYRKVAGIGQHSANSTALLIASEAEEYIKKVADSLTDNSENTPPESDTEQLQSEIESLKGAIAELADALQLSQNQKIRTLNPVEKQNFGDKNAGER